MLLILLLLFPFCLLLAFIFLVTPLKGWRWQRWFWIFTVANVADMASTFFAISAYNWDWSIEKNLIIQFLGHYVGFELILILLKIFVVGTAYLFGVYLGKFEFTRSVFFIVSVGLSLAVISNTLQGFIVLGFL